MTARTTTTRAVSYPRPGPATRHRCPTCRRWTWTGVDSNVCGLVATVDPVALDKVAEMVALLAGCRTLDLQPDGRLTRRGVVEIAAGQPRPVLAVHRCDRTNSGRPLTNPIPALPVIHTAGDGDTPPF